MKDVNDKLRKAAVDDLTDKRIEWLLHAVELYMSLPETRQAALRRSVTRTAQIVAAQIGLIPRDEQDLMTVLAVVLGVPPDDSDGSDAPPRVPMDGELA